MATQLLTIDPGQYAVALNAVTATGVGSAFIFKNSAAGNAGRFSWDIVVTGSPASVSVNAEASVDGVTWYGIDTSTTTTSEVRYVVNHPTRWIRANLATLSGGASPTVTVRFFNGGV